MDNQATPESSSFGAEHARREVEAETWLREEWWLNHGCPFMALYGDDGERQCSMCRLDFKRLPLPDLHRAVGEVRLKLAIADMQQPPSAAEQRLGAVEAALRTVLASAKPHPEHHPAMFAAWKVGEAALPPQEPKDDNAKS